MPISRLVAALSAVAFTLASAPLFAQGAEEKYGPEKFSRSELVDFGSYAKSPLDLPWRVTRTEQVPEAKHINFAHYLDASFAEVRQHFEDAARSQNPAIKLKPSNAPKGGPRGLKVLGTTRQGNYVRFTLGNDKMRRHFSVKLEEQEGETVLTFENLTLTLNFGGGVPKRAPFKPADAQPVPFAE